MAACEGRRDKARRNDGLPSRALSRSALRSCQASTIVIESTVGGDDSSNGAYLYVWFNNGRYPEARGDEQNFTGVFVSDRCIRGVSDGLCI